MQIPTKLSDANVYVDGADHLGKAEMTIPEVAQKMMEHDSFGIAGTVEIPLIGQFEKLEGKIDLHAMTREAAAVLYNPTAAPMLDVRSVFEYYDTTTGETHVYPVKVTIRAIFKKVTAPTLKKSTDEKFSAEYTANYMKIEIDGTEMLEIDQFNYIYRVEGRDLLAEHRTALGL